MENDIIFSWRQELFPLFIAVTVHIILLFIIKRKLKNRIETKLLFVYLLLHLLWQIGFVVFWGTSANISNLSSYYIGFTITFPSCAFFLFSITFPINKFKKKYYLFFLLPLCIWIPSALIGTMSVTGREFGFFQMPLIQVFNFMGFFHWLSILFKDVDKKIKNAASTLLLINVPTLIIACLSYYFSYFSINIPGFHAWLGDFSIALASAMTVLFVIGYYEKESLQIKSDLKENMGDIQYYLGKNKFDQVFKLLKSSLSNSKNKDLINKITLLEGRWSKLKSDSEERVITYEQEVIDTNKIRNALSKIIQQ